MIKRYILILAAFGSLFLVYKHHYKEDEKSPDDQLPVQVLAYRTSSGWGYEIEVEGKVFIHQDNIPAVQGNKSFQSADDALKVGTLVLDKMKNNKKPVITVDELKAMGIKNM